MYGLPYLNDKAEIDAAPARRLREACRSGEHETPTAGHAGGFVQTNLVILPQADAYDFLLFCQRNPKACPLLEVTAVGSREPALMAPGADVATDLPAYHVYQNGKLTSKPSFIDDLWREDFVAFLLGCSFTFEEALLAAGLPPKHLVPGRTGKIKNVPMYRTDIPCVPAGRFSGPLVVSMRPYRPADAIRAATVTARYPKVHGAPVHWGDPAAIGIADLSKPDYGDKVRVLEDEQPVFWACGVTPQAVVLHSKPEICITHYPGHMFVTDVTNEQLATG